MKIVCNNPTTMPYSRNSSPSNFENCSTHRGCRDVDDRAVCLCVGKASVRQIATQHPEPSLSDRKAAEIAEQLDYDFSKSMKRIDVVTSKQVNY